MINLPIGVLLKSHHHLSCFAQAMNLQIAKTQGMSISDRDYHEFLASANQFMGACNDIGFRVTGSAAKTLIEEIKLALSNNGQFGFAGENLLRVENYLNAVQSCLQHESALKVALIIPPGSEELFEPKEPLFGPEVATKLPSAAYEIDEAAKCLAVGRSTASAFHSIRCLEAGIRAISRCLAIPDPTRGSERSWANVLRAIREKIDVRWPNSSRRMTGDGQLFERLHGALAALQNPYRNTTMHLDAVYTEDEAKHIREMVGGLMREIASRMDEQGLPLA